MTGARWRLTATVAFILVGCAAATTLRTLARAQDGMVAAPTPTGAGPPPGTAAPLPPPGPPATVKIAFKAIPPNTRATVTWGKKKLGLIKPHAPLVIERPRDSGPLDVVVRADNCVPVHTRAYTFTDSTVAVRVTPVDKKNTIYGYREEPASEGDAGSSTSNADGGAPSPAGSP